MSVFDPARTKLARRRDHKSPNAAVNGALSKPKGEGLRRPFRGFVQPRRVARFDFVSQRRALAVGGSSVDRRGSLAAGLHDFDQYIGKTRGVQFSADLIFIMVA